MTDEYINLYKKINGRLQETAKTDQSLKDIDRLVDVCSVYEATGNMNEIVVEFSEAQSFATIRATKKIIDEEAKEANFMVKYNNLSGKIFEAE